MKKITFIFLAFLLIMTSCKNQVTENDEESNNNIEPIEECVKNDDKAPTIDSSLSVSDDGSTISLPQLSWSKAQETCEFSHYELAIGTSPGSTDVLTFINIGDVTTYRQKGIELVYNKDYYFSLKAVDVAGNKSEPLVSSSWQIFTPKTLTNMVLWLDSSQLDSISYLNQNHPGDTGFTDEVETWGDISGSSAVHDFEASSSNRPNWDVTEKAIRFSGSDQFMATVNHPDINTSTISQRTHNLAFKTDSDIQSRQVLYEEGGTVRGQNIYIEGDEINCSFWNVTNDGDGLQNFVKISHPIERSKEYVLSFDFDYSHFSGANAADGSLECYLNGESIGQTTTTSRLFAHPGEIGLGAVNGSSYFPDGPEDDGGYFFKGVIYEFLMYNSSHSQEDIKQLYDVLSSKWHN